MKSMNSAQSLLHHIRHRIHHAVHYIQHYHVHYILRQHLSIIKMNHIYEKNFFYIPVRASVFWYFGILHMLHVDRRAQLIFPQLDMKMKIRIEWKWDSYLLHIQSSGENRPPLFSAAFLPIDERSFEPDFGFRLSAAITIEMNVNLWLWNILTSMRITIIMRTSSSITRRPTIRVIISIIITVVAHIWLLGL